MMKLYRLDESRRYLVFVCNASLPIAHIAPPVYIIFTPRTIQGRGTQDVLSGKSQTTHEATTNHDQHIEHSKCLNNSSRSRSSHEQASTERV